MTVLKKWITVRRVVVDNDLIPLIEDYGKPVYAFDKLDAIVQNTLINGSDYVIMGEVVETINIVECDRFGPIPFQN